MGDYLMQDYLEYSPQKSSIKQLLPNCSGIFYTPNIHTLKDALLLLINDNLDYVLYNPIDYATTTHYIADLRYQLTSIVKSTSFHIRDKFIETPKYTIYTTIRGNNTYGSIKALLIKVNK